MSGFACGTSLDATNSPAIVEERVSVEDDEIATIQSVKRVSMGLDKPPRTANSHKTSSTRHHKKNHHHHYHHTSSSTTEEYDHHTLATAATASATISYSTDQGDDASEMGMEVIMSSSSNEQPQPRAEPYASHAFAAGKHTFVVDKRYTMIRTIGSGAYGVVISASDVHSQDNVAIKMVPKAFSDEIDAKRILREIKLLKHFQHENIVSLLDMMPPNVKACLLYTSPSPRDLSTSRMPSSA